MNDQIKKLVLLLEELDGSIQNRRTWHIKKLLNHLWEEVQILKKGITETTRGVKNGK